ncbi:MAG: hypothetical protein ABIU07_03950 [Ramlibacter sp.]
MAQVLNLGGIQSGQVRLLGPKDAHASRSEIFSRSLEPETTGIARTLIQTHVMGGLAGGFAGLAVFAWFYKAGHPMVASSPLLALIALGGFGITFGLLAAGLAAMRPDHILLISTVRSALRHNRWAVVTHPTDRAQTAKVKQVLLGNSAEVLSTF